MAKEANQAVYLGICLWLKMYAGLLALLLPDYSFGYLYVWTLCFFKVNLESRLGAPLELKTQASHL